jgi:hypothetical protein
VVGAVRFDHQIIGGFAMRPFAVVLLFAVTSTPAYGADKKEDEAKAKEAAALFMKAVTAKDIDAVMKTVDAPFFMKDREPKLIEKTEDLKTEMKSVLARIKDPNKIAAEILSVHDLPELKKMIMEKKNSDKDKEKKMLELIEKALGEKGYAVVLGKGGESEGAVLVRIKDGTAKVVGIFD